MTPKLIGLAVLVVSTGAIDPLTRQCAGTAPAASTQIGDDSVTLPTGAPIADGAIDVPVLADVQSAALITTSGPNRRSCVSEDGRAWALIDGPRSQTTTPADRTEVSACAKTPWSTPWGRAYFIRARYCCMTSRHRALYCFPSPSKESESQFTTREAR